MNNSNEILVLVRKTKILFAVIALLSCFQLLLSLSLLSTPREKICTTCKHKLAVEQAGFLEGKIVAVSPVTPSNLDNGIVLESATVWVEGTSTLEFPPKGSR